MMLRTLKYEYYKANVDNMPGKSDASWSYNGMHFFTLCRYNILVLYVMKLQYLDTSSMRYPLYLRAVDSLFHHFI